MSKSVLNQLMPACLLVSVFMFFSCQEKDYYDPSKANPDPEDYVGDAASTLDFSTSRSVKLDLNYQIGDGFVSVFDLYTEYPLTSDGSLRTDLEPIAGGFNVVGSQLSRTIPAYVKEVYAYSPNLFIPMLSYAKIENGVAKFEAVKVEVERTPETRAGNAGSFWKTPISEYLKKKDDFYTTEAKGIYVYDIIEPDYKAEIPTKVKNMISSTFPDRKIVDEKYYKDATIKIVKGKDTQTGAKVFVSPIAASANLKNSFSYFVYEGKTELTELPKEEVEKLEKINILQYASVYTNSLNWGKGITPGKYIQLLYRNKEGKLVEEFPVGAQIGWILHPNGFVEEDFTVNSSVGNIFSVSYWNDKNNKTNTPDVKTNNYNIFFSTRDENLNLYNCFGFEDQVGGYPDGDCNDLVFHLLTDPVDAIVPAPGITEIKVRHSESKKGVLAFEDQWPSIGDYDLNDVVVKYKSTISYLQKKDINDETLEIEKEYDVFVEKIEDTFSFIHTGADYNNAFSYKINVPSNTVKRILVTDMNTKECVNFTSSIVEDGDGFIIDLCKNVRKVIEPMEYGVTPQDYKVEIEFYDEAVLQDDFAAVCAPYNPFIAPAEKPGVEIHLPMYPPTNRVNEDLFGTDIDRSDKSTTWYVSGENNLYPFAIHLMDADDFKAPVEREKIYTTYPKYLDWVKSGMTTNEDWYKQ